MKALPKITGSATDKKEAHEARMSDPDYSYAVQHGLAIRGNWRKRAHRERLEINRSAEADSKFWDACED